jgi:hypothetical protein
MKGALKDLIILGREAHIAQRTRGMFPGICVQEKE